MSENKISILEILYESIHKNDSKLPICYICEVELPLTKDNFINRVTCGGFEGDYWHKKCFKKERKRIQLFNVHKSIPLFNLRKIKIDL